MKPSKDFNRMANALEAAENSFWHTISEAYPEASFGDFPPDASIKFSAATEEAVTLWLEVNADPLVADKGNTEVLFHNIEYSFCNPNQDIDDHVEQIAYEITNGSRSGELFFTDFANNGGERTVVGEWEINNG